MKGHPSRQARSRRRVALVHATSDLKPLSHINPGGGCLALFGRRTSVAIRMPGRTSIISNCGILFSLLDLSPIFTVYTGFATVPRGLWEAPAPLRRRRPLEHSTPPASQQPLGSAPAE